jgi:serine/threonine protein phosphatase PrpC
LSRETVKKVHWNETETVARVQPAGLSVSRTIGDFGVKSLNPGAVIPDPEVVTHTLSGNEEYLLLGCDGIFDVLTNK